jgi:molybdopterin converting factor small subunit
MRIQLILEAILSKYAPENSEAYELPFEMTIGQLIGHLGIPEDLVMFAIVDSQMATLDTVVRENASVSLCPYICGG